MYARIGISQRERNREIRREIEISFLSYRRERKEKSYCWFAGDGENVQQTHPEIVQYTCKNTASSTERK